MIQGSYYEKLEYLNAYLKGNLLGVLITSIKTYSCILKDLQFDECIFFWWVSNYL